MNIIYIYIYVFIQLFVCLFMSESAQPFESNIRKRDYELKLRRRHKSHCTAKQLCFQRDFRALKPLPSPGDWVDIETALAAAPDFLASSVALEGVCYAFPACSSLAVISGLSKRSR